jgi:putative CocE/NonD family hydrolase
MRRTRHTKLAVLLFLAGAASATAQSPDSIPGFSSRLAMIPMRDGARLHTRIYRPLGHDEPLPILMVRTPYGIEGRAARVLPSDYRELVSEGYVFVFQDIRGRYASEGEFVMTRPLRAPSDSRGVDETTDTWDTVEWLVTNVAGNNGRAGVLGVSYPGWLAAMAGINPHPAVRAVSPQAPMTDVWLGDDFFHQGAFRLSYGFEYAADMELSKDGSVPVPVTRYDTYDWYLAQGPLGSLTTLLGGKAPTWTAFTQHPAYDGYWQRRALTGYLTRLTVPTLTVGGWWDQEDFFGPLATYAALEKLDTAGINYLVMGPWNHGGWSRRAGDSLGSIDFMDSTGAWFREQVQAPWFAYWLKDKGRLPLPEALLFVAGRNGWKAFDRWPPAATEAPVRKLYFRANGGLSFESPGRPADEYDEFVSDPAHPVPYRRRPIQLTYDPRGSDWSGWQVEDQRLVHNRPDVLSWETEPLAEELTIAGKVAAKLFATTTGADADWVVKLIDVYPDSAKYLAPRMGGYQLMVTGDILRGRYRTGWDRPTPIVPNRVTAYTVDLRQQAYTFRKGHRVMVQVQSSWFPVYDRNPQTWVANIFTATAADFRAQTHRIYRMPRFPSHVEIQVLTP